MTAIPNILRLLPIFLVAACATQKAPVVEEPKKKPDTAKLESTPAPLAPGADDGLLRDPSDLLNKLPDKNEFQATNPKSPAGNSEGAPVIAHPPSENPAPGR